jgi:hydroxyacylglutathione hydrolase
MGLMEIITLVVGPIQTNCYLVICSQTKAAAVIDPGGNPEKILGAARERGASIEWVLNTHAHWDHMMANADVMAGSGASLAIHEGELPLLRARGGADSWGIPGASSPEPGRLLVPGEALEIGTLRLEVLFTPGHTPGHVSFYEAQQKTLFDGDVLFYRGIGRADLPGGNHAALLRSIEEKLLTLPDDVVVYPGHGPKTTIGEERCLNPWF